ncbi:MAG: sulfatase-like hydrolase/transferase, partial [Actinomycetales bacterium]|nr:sulfatase-like hydrolase/transferase [Actinomycetales bacterium]
IDGLNPEAFNKLEQKSSPNFTTLLTQGASTLNARSSAQSTKRLPNHTGMLTGREVRDPAGHGVTQNKDNGSTLEADNDDYVPSIFDIAHDRGLATAFYAEKDKFSYLARSWNGTNGAPDSIGEDDGRNKIDRTAIADAPIIVRLAAERIKQQDTDFVFLHLSGGDAAGHEHGWLGFEYLTALTEIDKQLGTLMAAAAESERPVTFVITSDHGGAVGRKQHRTATKLANARVPFITFGDGIGVGKDLYALNPGRHDPHNEVANGPQSRPIRNLDLANVSLGLLGLPLTPGTASSSWPSLSLS